MRFVAAKTGGDKPRPYGRAFPTHKHLVLPRTLNLPRPRDARALETDLDRRAKYMEFIDAYAGLDEDEYRRYERDHAEESKAMAGAIQRARDEGRQEGMQEGTRIILQRQLQHRFGLLSPRVAERLRRASAGDLETWADQLLDANTIDEVFRPSREKLAP